MLYFDLHFRCLALMHYEIDQSLVTAEGDKLQLDSDFGVPSKTTLIHKTWKVGLNLHEKLTAFT